MAQRSLASLAGVNTDDQPTPAPAPPPPVTVTKRPARTRRGGEGKAPATVYTSREVHTALRKHAAKTKATEVTSYGVIVLRAVQEHRQELRSLWNEPADKPGEDDDLFDLPVRRPRPKKIAWQLHGARREHVQTLDRLVDEWGAPSRSVLVEEALTRYLKIKVGE